MNRKPNSTKIALATARTDRQKAPPSTEQLVKVPAPPKTASEPAAAEWKRLAPLLVQAGTLTTSDLRALELMCETLATANELADIVRREGPTIEAAGGGRKGHPALQSLGTARAQARALLNDFGLSPRGREGVAEAPTPKANKPWHSEFFS